MSDSERDGAEVPPAPATYYLLNGRRVGKRDDGDSIYEAERGWVADDSRAIQDRFMGYDPHEPAGSPYGMFNSSIMDEIETITAADALARIAEHPQGTAEGSEKQ